MPAYTVFDAGTGEVLRSGVCAEADLHLQSRAPNEIVAEGAFRDDEYRFALTTAGGMPVMSPRKRPRRN